MNTQIDTRLTRRQVLQGAAGAAAVALAGGGMIRTAAAQTAGAPSVGEMAFHGAGFEPMTARLVSGESITLHNMSKDPLEVASAPTAPAAITGKADPGKTVDLVFDKPGIYVLFDPRTTRFDEKVGQVVANKDSPYAPLPAYACVMCTDKRGGGISLTTPNIVIPDTYMTFQPWAIVVAPGQAIHFTNNDSDMHIAMPSPTPMLMPKDASSPKPGEKLWMEKMSLFAPITLGGGGGTGTLTISQPGLHHYYCPIHCAYKPDAYTFVPLASYGGYPFIMDGVIAVVPR